VVVCVLVPVRMDGDSRVGIVSIVSSCGIVYNWNSLLPAPVIEDAEDRGDSNNESEEDAANNAGRGTARLFVFLDRGGSLGVL